MGNGAKGDILFHEREYPPLNPPRERFRLAVSGLNNLYAFGMQLPARGVAAVSVAIRFDFLLLSAAALPILSEYNLISVYRGTPQCGERSNAAFGKQSAAVLPSLAPHDSKARLLDVSNRRDSWRSHVHRTHTAQRVQLFKLQTANVNFLWEGLREGYLFLKKRYPSLIRIPTSGGEIFSLHQRRKPYFSS